MTHTGATAVRIVLTRLRMPTLAADTLTTKPKDIYQIAGDRSGMRSRASRRFQIDAFWSRAWRGSRGRRAPHTP
jgi:hypothetical protein